MALRHDYYSECAIEIERKIGLIETLIENITPSDYDEHLGIENTKCSEECESEITDVIGILNSMIETLEAEKKRLAMDAADVGGWL